MDIKQALLCGFFVLSSLFLQSFPVSAQDNCLISACHGNLTAKAVVHSPVEEGECASCHQSTGAKHPGGKAGFRLVGHVKDLCTQCHDDIVASPKLHGPVKAGRCNYCHNPHSSDSANLLTAKDNTVCFRCHGGIERIIASAKSQHQPVAEGNCWDCHNPHGSEFKPLLRSFYPRPFYVSFAEENFGLCFTCHDAGAFVYERTSEATNFRNGDYNLHVLHVNRPKKGRVCKSCHGVHGADQDKLILSAIPGFGSWEIPIQFDPGTAGATCYVGCHKPKTYDRLRPTDILREQKTVHSDR